jgi:cell division protein FtsZ
MTEMGKAMMGTGEAEGENRAREAAEAAISNPLLDDVSMKGAKGVLINITGGPDLTLYEVDEAANRIGEEVDDNANIIFGSTLDPALEGRMRVSVVATGIDAEQSLQPKPVHLTVVNNPTPRPMPAPRPAAAPAPMAAAPMPRPMVPPAPGPMPAPAMMVASAAMVAPAPAPEPMVAWTTPTAIEAEPSLPIAEAAAQSPLAEDAARAVETARAEAMPEAFMPPPPLEPAMPAPESRTIARPVVPRSAPTRNRVSSLLARIRGNEEKVEAPAAAKPAMAPNPPARPAEARLESAKAAEPEQPSLGLGGLDANERLRGTQSDDDLLEIPAFLRRQAN